MKRTILCIITIILSSNFFLLEAAVIKNMINRTLIITLKSGKTVNLLAGGSAVISDSDMTTPALESLIRKHYITVVNDPPKLIKK